jgi:hypothetical protein
MAEALPVAVDLDWLVNGRATLLGLHSHGQTSANGTCRLLPTAHGWVAVNLPRPTDVEALPAVAEEVIGDEDPWSFVARFAARRTAEEVADRCQLLGVAGARLEDPAIDGSRAAVLRRCGPADADRRARVVVDLSSMWAGPLCAHLLGRVGMHVVKVESIRRPDGARFGDTRLFEWLHEGHELRTLDFDDPEGHRDLAELVHEADVVIESTRPRALRQLGIDANDFVASRAGRTWVSITGYGRSGAAAHRVAFGDDAAVAGGLVTYDEQQRPAFCADAIADPMSGLFAAATAYRSITTGGGHLVDVAMAAVAKSLAAE